MPEQHRKPAGTLEQFSDDTTTEQATALMGLAFHAITQGWPAIYFRQPALNGSPAIIDLDAMIRDSGNLAILLQKEILYRTLYTNPKE